MRVRRRGLPGWVYVWAAALLTGSSIILARLWLPGAVAAGAAAAAAVIAGVWAARGAAVSQERAGERHAATWLVRLDEYGGLPLIRDVDDPVSIGVHPAAPLRAGPLARTPAFVTRDTTAELQETLLRDRFVLLMGESAAGKSRAAYEAMRALFPGGRLVEPMSRDGLSAALERAANHPGCVLWLDDLERFLGHGGLTGQSIRNLLAAPGKPRHILATMRAEEHARFSGGIGRAPDQLASDAVRHSREVLSLATGITVPRSWSPQELARAAQHRDPRIAEAVKHADRFGLAEYLAAGPQLLADWQDGWAPGTHPRGAALVLAAVDARRAGVHRPLPVPLLNQLHAPYLHARGGELLRLESLHDALEWATTPLHATSSLLVPAGDGSFLAFDYLIDSIPRQPVPAATLDALIGYATWGEAMDIGLTAWNWELLDQAETAFRAAETGGQFDATAHRYYLILERDGTSAALEFAREALASRIQTLGPQHRDTFEARRLLLGEEGDAQTDADGNVPVAPEIAARFAELHADAVRVLGPEARTTLNIRYAAIYWTMDAGDPVRAASQAGDLTADCARILGPDDSLTWSSRGLLAICTGEAGDPETALRLLDQLTTDAQRLDGDRGNFVMQARQTRATWLARARRHQDAVREWEVLVTELRSTRGDLHAQTLNARHALAESIGECGNPGIAAELLRQLIADASRVADEASFALLIYRRSLAVWTGRAGDATTAARQLRQLAERSARQRGENDRYTQGLRQRLAEWDARAGNGGAPASP
jgi:eukaryotic-like serine/threonine-protein kinase